MRAVLVCPNPTLRSDLEASLAKFEQIVLSKVLREYPSGDALRRLIRVWAPDVVFLSIENVVLAEELNAVLAEFPAVSRIAIAEAEQQSALRAALRLRMVELITPPFGVPEIKPILEELQRLHDLHPGETNSQNHFCAFMPAKGGVGASTIAANVANALGEMPESSILLADFDFHAGVAGFLFNAQNDFSLCDAMARSKVLDDDTWQRLTCRKNNIDLLLSPDTASPVDGAIHESQLTPVLDFAHRNYSVVCADIPDSFDDRTLLVLREASKIFIVTTPELAPLRMARLKAMALQRLEWHDKAHLVVNRVTKSMELSLAEIEKTVGLPIFASFPSEYGDVTQAARDGVPAPRLQTASREFAHRLLQKKFEPKRHRFIERFTVVPARYAFR